MDCKAHIGQFAPARAHPHTDAIGATLTGEPGEIRDRAGLAGSQLIYH